MRCLTIYPQDELYDTEISPKMKSIVQAEAKESMICNFCDQVFPEDKIRSHLSTHFEFGILNLCSACGYFYKNQKFVKHSDNCYANKLKLKPDSPMPQEIVSISVDLPLKPIFCPISNCKQKFDLQKAFMEFHQNYHKPTISVEKTDMKSETLDVMIEIMKICEPLTCEFCGELFDLFQDLQSHYENCQPKMLLIEQKQSKKKSCPFCDQEFWIDQIDSHVKNHLELFNEQFKSTNPEKFIRLCEYCGLFFRSNNTHFADCQKFKISVQNDEKIGEKKKFLCLPVTNPMGCPSETCSEKILLQDVFEIYHHEKHSLTEKINRQLIETKHQNEKNLKNLTSFSKAAKISYQFISAKQQTGYSYCKYCHKWFSSDKLNLHIISFHPNTVITCGACFEKFIGQVNYYRLLYIN